MKQVLETLKKCEIFSEVPESVLTEIIIPLGTVREIPKDTNIITYQEKVDFFGVVISGRIWVNRP